MMDIAVDNKNNNRLGQYLTERRWVVVFALSIMLITTLPYFLGYSVEINDPQHAWRFTGFIFGVEDGNSYIAKALAGTFGAWLFRTPYTVIPQNGVIAFLPYLLLGKLVSAPGMHEQLVVLFHLYRFLAGILAILATYDFICYFVSNNKLRGFGLVIASVGGGLGWVIMLTGKDSILGSLPLEFYSPEAFGFLGLYGLPHIALSRALLFWGILWHFQLSSQSNMLRYSDAIKIGVIWLCVALLQPLTAFIMGLVLGFHLAILIAPGLLPSNYRSRERVKEIPFRIKIFLFELIPALPFFIYYLIIYSSDPFIKIWSNQNIISSPHPLHYLLAYGLLFPLALIGIYVSLKIKKIETNVLIVWFLAGMVLAYIPVSIQRRLVEGIWVVLVVLMLVGYQWLEENRPIMKLGWCIPVITILVLPSTLILIIGGIMASITPSEPLFRPNAEIVSFEFLNGFVKMDEVVMTSYDTGNVLPAYSPVRVLIGHGPESADLATFTKIISSFYDSEISNEMRQRIIQQYNIKYVYWGPHEQALGDWNPAQVLWLDQIFHLDGYLIFAVNEP